MATTLSQLMLQRDALIAQLTAAQSLQHGDSRVQYRPIAEIQAAIASIDGQIAEAGGNVQVRSIKVTTSKDL